MIDCSVNKRHAITPSAGYDPIDDAIEFGEMSKYYQQSTFGTHFVEVHVRRMLAACASGRILNPKAARSWVIDAMTMDVGRALMEELRWTSA